jgi:hypothetical protein
MTSSGVAPRAAAAVDHVGELDVARLAHRARVERRQLCHVVVGGADEPRGVGGVGDQHAVAVDAVAGEPFAVLAEVLADGADQGGRTAQDADRVGHVARHATAVDHQIVDQEAQRHLLQVFGQQLLGEPPGKAHQVVGRNGSGHGNRH